MSTSQHQTAASRPHTEMSHPRIAALLPGATEIVYLLGLGDQLVGVSHECDYPPAARDKPVVTQSPFDPHRLASAEIDRLVTETVATGRELYHLDPEALARVQPDLILTQGLCDVCAVSVKTVSATLPEGPRLLSLDAGTLDEMLADVARVAEAAGVPERGAAVVAGLRARLDAVAAAARGLPRRRVVCLEWLDPPYSAGHWVPEMVALAGGEELLAAPGERSRRVAWDEVVVAAPEVLLLMPCGFGVERSLAELGLLARLSGWDDLPAVRAGEVWAVDGSAYFSRPGPRLVDGVELVASLLHPGTFGPAPDRAAARALAARPS
jgi:iron complex transport system substrate-binding protein